MATSAEPALQAGNHGKVFRPVASKYCRSGPVWGKHDAKIKQPWTTTGQTRPLRHALEVRHDSFRTPEFIGLLRRNRIALVVADTAGKWPFLQDVTADFIYVRLHGDKELYVSGYTPRALGAWAKKIRVWSKGGNVPKGQLTAAPAAARSAVETSLCISIMTSKFRRPTTP